MGGFAITNCDRKGTRRQAEPSLRLHRARCRDALEEYGRDAESFGIEGFTNIGAPEDVWRSRIEDWQDAGATHVSVRTMSANLASPQAHIDALRRYREVAVG